MSPQPTLKSWVQVAPDSDFSIYNIPFGIVSTEENPAPRAASIIGDHVIDLSAAATAGLFTGPHLSAHAISLFSEPTLNRFMSLGRPAWREARATLTALLLADGPDARLRSNPELQAKVLVPRAKARNHLPASIGDYTDFYASKEHATNVGVMFRGKENALMPNWVHLPVGYHGRASSVVVSGTPIRRPCGLVQDFVTKAVGYSQSKKLDYEVEVAFFVGVGNELGDRIDIGHAEEHIFGMVLMNDWSARDIQAFEYVPLGPFLGKNFGTTISPWIVTLDALEAFRVPQPAQDPVPAEYLVDKETKGDAYDIHLETYLTPSNSSAKLVTCRTNFKHMYWSFKQQLAHHTVNGCNARPGDLCASGTISGPTKDSVGSLLEASVNGKEPLTLTDAGESHVRTFIQDGDTVVMRGWCTGTDAAGQSYRVGFGECVGTVLRAAFGGVAAAQ
ncbi:hypothetical protein HDU96_004604 [Phlyctochytrium bullatum]|nr:hypothetical protein HDU96_004604 [Phlyctochytrium bullatum]